MKPPPNDRRVCEIVRDFLIGLAVFFAVFTLAMLDSRASRSAPAVVSKPATMARSATLSPANVTAGTLLLRVPENGRGSDVTVISQRALLLDTDVNITVTGPIARTTLTQKFRNTSGLRVEGIYAFPLPEMAAVDALSMHIGKRIVKGEIKPRAEARRIYQSAKDAGMLASPLSQHRPNFFTSSFPNITPGEEVTIRIEYQETLQRNNDAYSLRFPLVVAPRYTAKHSLHSARYDRQTGIPLPAQPGRDRETGNINPVSLQVRLDSGFALDRVTSDSHEIAVRRVGETGALVAFMQGRVPADRDFELTWKAKGSALPQTAVFQENLLDGAYVLAMLAPPKIEAAPAPVAREVVFVIDTSGSMAGTSILQAKQSLTLALERLKPGDRFNIIRFDSSFEELFEEPVAVTRESLAIATHFVSKLKSHGGTEMLPALRAALKDVRRADHSRVRQVVFLTDGAISNETQLFNQLAAKRGRSRLFMVGIGSAPNSFLMRRAAEIGRGSFIHIASSSQVLERLNILFQRLERPVITDLKLQWAPGLRTDAWPNPLPDLYAGEPILIAAKTSALKGNLFVTGKISGRPWKRAITLSNAARGKGVAKFWARQKIASLEARLHAGQTMSDVDAAIEAVALKHHLVSRMTSLVAADATPSRPEDQPLAREDQPVNLPAGWVYDKVLAAPGPARSELKRSIAPAPPAGLHGQKNISAKPAADMSRLALKSANRGMGSLPVAQAPSTTDRTWMIPVMALLFAAMMAMTLGLWRHLRNSVTPKRTRRGNSR